MKAIAAVVALVVVACGGVSPPPAVSPTPTAVPTERPPVAPTGTVAPTASVVSTVTATPSSTASAAPTTTAQETPAMPLTVTSDAFADGEAIPSEYTCDGADEQPILRWTGVPEATAELALVMHDPDAGGFVHWVVAGIPPKATELGGELPAGAVGGRNDFGRLGYAGPCPPSGNHGYVFTLYALSEPLGLTGDVTARAVRQGAQDRTLATAVLTGTYRRS